MSVVGQRERATQNRVVEFCGALITLVLTCSEHLGDAAGTVERDWLGD
jgi:hypothetical protein